MRNARLLEFGAIHLKNVKDTILANTYTVDPNKTLFQQFYNDDYLDYDFLPVPNEKSINDLIHRFYEQLALSQIANAQGAYEGYMKNF